MSVASNPSVSNSSPIATEITGGSRFDYVMDKVTHFVFFFFQTLVSFYKLEFRHFYWVCKNGVHLKKPPAFLFGNPPLFSRNSSIPDPFPELLKEYRTLMKIPINSDKEINRQLKKGFCHGEVLQLVRLMQDNKTSLAELIPHLKKCGSEITFFEMLEIFRGAFQEHRREDLLQKLQTLLPTGYCEEKNYARQSDDIAQCLKNDLEKFSGVVVIKLFNHARAHTILLSVDPKEKKWGIYNPTFFGLYEYGSLDSFANAVVQHVNCLNKYTDWKLTFFPILRP